MVFDFQINFDKQRKLQRKTSPWGLFRIIKFGIFFSNHALIVCRYYNQYGFMTHHWKACEPNKLKMPACNLYLVPGPRKTAFLQPPLKWPAHPEPFVRLFGRHLEIFSQILMKHLGGGLAPTWINPPYCLSEWSTAHFGFQHSNISFSNAFMCVFLFHFKFSFYIFIFFRAWFRF